MNKNTEQEKGISSANLHENLQFFLSCNQYQISQCILYLKVYGTIQKELGKSMDELFSDFVNEPLATASVRS